MFQEMKKRIKNEKGLTLIELLAVIVILAIIAAIAVPAIGNIIDNSRYKAVKSDALNVLNAANIYFADNASKDDVSVGYLVNKGYLEDPGTIPGTSTDTELSTFVASDNNSFVSKKAGGNTITTIAIDYGGENKLTFTGATTQEINDHTDKTDNVIGD